MLRKLCQSRRLKLQPEFDRRKNSENFPFNTSLSSKQIKRIFDRAMRQSERYQNMKAAGASEQEIHDAFCTLTPMSVYTYHGDVDTVMTPLDSIRYYKAFLRSGLVSIDPSNGFVKAYVGGLNYAHFQYDMAMTGRRQIGSTMKPFVYVMALEDGYTPESLVLNAQRTYRVGGSFGHRAMLTAQEPGRWYPSFGDFRSRATGPRPTS